MNTNRGIAVVAGVAFLIATLAQLVGAALVSPLLSVPVDLIKISANENQVRFGKGAPSTSSSSPTATTSSSPPPTTAGPRTPPGITT
jgi:hypothetical protein